MPNRSGPPIVVEDLHEIFRIYHQRPAGLKERLYRFSRSSYERFHALDGVSLKVDKGETVALVGHNGSGKTTLLKVLARILPADEGSVRVRGRVATLLELGAGFHQDLSGRENIYLNGAILGLTRREIDAALDSIIDFAGVRAFIDTPVRNYSSGMYVRLGFAIAVHVDPDILLIDEVLSVGDAAFQEKCLERMRAFKDSGKTVVLVSHDLAAVRSLCDRTVVLHAGRIVFDGSTEEALAHYQALMATGALPDAGQPAPDRLGDHRARIAWRRLEVPGHHVDQPLPSGAKARIEFEVEARDDLIPDGGLSLGIDVRRPDVAPSVYETRTSWRTTYVAPPPPGKRLAVSFELELHLLTGAYSVDLVVGNASSNVIHDRWLGAVEFVVHGERHDKGLVPLNAEIAVQNPDGVWPPESHPPSLEDGGPRHHPVRDGADQAPAAGG